MAFNTKPTLVFLNQGIQQLAEQALFDIFAKRDESLISTNFVNCMFVLNDYQNHAVYNKNRAIEGCICLHAVGSKGKSMRFKIYRTMLALYIIKLTLYIAELTIYCTKHYTLPS